MHRAEPWTIADILDLEYLLAAEARGTSDPGQKDDRAWAEQNFRGEPPPRTELFRQWVNFRRGGEALPGTYFAAGWQTLLTVGALLGLLIGVSLTGGLLHYKGDEPVNVAWFFAATVGVQWVLLLLALAAWVLRRMTSLFEGFHPLRWLSHGLAWSFSAGLRRLPGEKREQVRATLATLNHRREIYGSLLGWPPLVLSQLFGVAFNVGVLATLLLHVALSDLAFAWQSTLRTSPEEAFRLVSALALPWTWAPHAHPTLEQVIGSRFIYSAGIQPLSTAATAAWWPFLTYAVACYGLLVRGSLLALAVIRWRGSRRSLTFDHQGCNALYRRLTGPFIRATSTASLALPSEPGETPLPRQSGTCLLLVSNDLEQPAALESLLAAQGLQVAGTHAVRIDHPSANSATLEAVTQAGPATVVVAVRGKRPPIRAIALFLQKVAAAAQGETLLLLLGKPTDSGWEMASDEDFTHWRNFNAIHGLHLEIERWSPA